MTGYSILRHTLPRLGLFSSRGRPNGAMAQCYTGLTPSQNKFPPSTPSSQVEHTLITHTHECIAVVFDCVPAVVIPLRGEANPPCEGSCCCFFLGVTAGVTNGESGGVGSRDAESKNSICRACQHLVASAPTQSVAVRTCATSLRKHTCVTIRVTCFPHSPSPCVTSRSRSEALMCSHIGCP